MRFSVIPFTVLPFNVMPACVMPVCEELACRCSALDWCMYNLDDLMTIVEYWILSKTYLHSRVVTFNNLNEIKTKYVAAYPSCLCPLSGILFPSWIYACKGSLWCLGHSRKTTTRLNVYNVWIIFTVGINIDQDSVNTSATYWLCIGQMLINTQLICQPTVSGGSVDYGLSVWWL